MVVLIHHHDFYPHAGRRLCRLFNPAMLVVMFAVMTTAGLGYSQPISAAEPALQKESATAQGTHKPMMAGSDIHNSRACNANGIALAGIDVVSYHKPTGPLVGSADYVVTHNDLTYHFLSAAHAAEFTTDPDRYLPKYLGWCATSLAVGALTCPNPLNYKLEDGALLLFETTGFTNGQNLWNADPLDYRRRANKNRDAFLQMSGS